MATNRAQKVDRADCRKAVYEIRALQQAYCNSGVRGRVITFALKYLISIARVARKRLLVVEVSNNNASISSCCSVLLACFLHKPLQHVNDDVGIVALTSGPLSRSILYGAIAGWPLLLLPLPPPHMTGRKQGWKGGRGRTYPVTSSHRLELGSTDVGRKQ